MPKDNFGTESGYGQISPFKQKKVFDPEAQATQQAVQGDPQLATRWRDDQPSTGTVGYTDGGLLRPDTPWQPGPETRFHDEGGEMDQMPVTGPGVNQAYQTELRGRTENDIPDATGSGGITGDAGTGAVTPGLEPGGWAYGHPEWLPGAPWVGGTATPTSGAPGPVGNPLLQGGLEAGQSGAIMKQVLQQLLSQLATRKALGGG